MERRPSVSLSAAGAQHWRTEAALAVRLAYVNSVIISHAMMQLMSGVGLLRAPVRANAGHFEQL